MKYVNHARFCDSTCWFCAREFFNWYKSRMAQMDMTKNGNPSFAVAAAGTKIAGDPDTEHTDMATRVASACQDGAVLTSALADLALALF